MSANQGRPFPWSEPLAGHIAVALIPAAGDQLLRLKDRTRLSAADVVNRAIISYAFIDAQLRDDQEVLLRDKKTGGTQTVVLL